MQAGDADSAARIKGDKRPSTSDARDVDFMRMMNAHSMIPLNGLFDRRADFTFHKQATNVEGSNASVTLRRSVVDYIAIDADSLHLVDAAHGLRVDSTTDAALRLDSDHLLLHTQLQWTAPPDAQLTDSDDCIDSSPLLHKSKRVAYSLQDMTRRHAFTSKSSEAMRWWLGGATSRPLETLAGAADRWQFALHSALHATAERRKLRPGATPRAIKAPRSDALRSLDNDRDEAYKQLRLSTGASNRHVALLYDRFCRARKLCNVERQRSERKWGLEQAAWLSTLQFTDSRRFWQRLNRVAGIDTSLRGVPLHQVVLPCGAVHHGVAAVVQHYTAAFAHRTPSGATEPLPVFAHSPSLGGLDADFTIDEVGAAIDASRCGKASGLDDIPAEALKYAGDGMRQSLASLFNRCLCESDIPPSWRVGLITLLHKAGDRRTPTNYRPVTLLPTVAKTLCRVINTRLASFLEQSHRLAEAQFGRPRRSCTDAHILCYQSLQLHVVEQRGIVYCASVDLSKAFDTICRRRLLDRLHSLGVTGRLHSLIRSIYSDVRGRLQLGAHQTDEFAIHSGVKQGCCLSGTLFNVYLDSLLRELQSTLPDEQQLLVGTTRVAVIAYCDDLTLLADSPHKLQQLLDTLHRWCAASGMAVNTHKTRAVVFTRKRIVAPFHLRYGDETLQVDSSCRFLGVTYESRLYFAAHRACIEQRALLRSHQTWLLARLHIPLATRLHVLNVLVRPLLESFVEVVPFDVIGKTGWAAAESILCRNYTRLLGARRNTSHAALRGDLGVEAHGERRDGLKLLHHAKRLLQQRVSIADDVWLFRSTALDSRLRFALAARAQLYRLPALQSRHTAAAQHATSVMPVTRVTALTLGSRARGGSAACVLQRLQARESSARLRGLKEVW